MPKQPVNKLKKHLPDSIFKTLGILLVAVLLLLACLWALFMLIKYGVSHAA